MQGKAKNKVQSAAFVTFKDTFTTTIAATSMMHHDRRHWTTKAAPSPRLSPSLAPYVMHSTCFR